MQKVSPCLLFDDQAEEAAKFYVSVFKNSKILQTTYYGEGMPMPAGTVLTVKFLLDGEEFLALNGGSHDQFSLAVSFMVMCETQAEVDDYWRKLTVGGQEVQCGWLKDKFGLAWQIVPKQFIEMLDSPDKAAVQRGMAAMMMTMKKLDIAELQKAYDNA
ncbi:MAG: VOC family protein [Planctomycetota bacterium]|nr:VOC family protein [Planctomycetaceae bacterium]MDQ3330826.1 VOC family protein [Planctomycetota bacterium]